jgi:YebC/PmpR family DNA-binding regulatory protein
MAGHSHSANVARRKNAVDAKRARVWSKIAKKLMVAAKRGADPATNLALRYCIDDAKSANMPKDTIQKAIDKGSGASGTDHFEEVIYEAYGPGGVGMILEALTDNRARTAADLRTIFDRNGGNLATSGSVGFNFQKKGVISLSRETVAEERLIELALEAGAEDVSSEVSAFIVLTAPGDFHRVKDALDAARLAPTDARLTYVPGTSVKLDADTIARFDRLLDLLEDNDDVQDVHHNAEL